MEKWLDSTPHVAHLRNPAIAEMTREAIAFRNERTWRMFEFVIMPNHLHLLFEVCRGNLKTCVEDFKRWTGHRALEILGANVTRFWQDEWFDHWARDDDEVRKIAEYIRQNPVKVKLVGNHEDWPYGSWSK